MGVNLTPIVIKKVVDLETFKGRTFAVDAFNVIHQFLALIRTRDGRPLTDGKGNVTSHLVGLAFRTTKLISEHRMKLAFVFDGKPPKLKGEEVEKRRTQKKKAEKEYIEALESGDYTTAFSKAVQTGRITETIVNDAKRLLDLLGIPSIQAPSEGEAQAAFMARRGDVWAASSRDYDSLLFGAPRLIRYLTIQGEEWLPSKGKARRLEPEIINLNEMLEFNKVALEQLVDLAILVGTDFNAGIKGIGPKTALKLIKKHGRLENLPEKVLDELPEEYDVIRQIYLEPKVTKEYQLKNKPIKREELYYFLCEEKAFSKKRVDTIVNRMEQAQRQRSLSEWFQSGA